MCLMRGRGSKREPLMTAPFILRTGHSSILKGPTRTSDVNSCCILRRKKWIKGGGAGSGGAGGSGRASEEL